jgi:Rrf2 family transcriptional regulator, nitric oxide-sensitive transcriptional repressor
MNSLLRISEAASLALHTMVYLAAKPKTQTSSEEIANTLSASKAHLSKVLQRLSKVGLVHSTRGPKGGFTLGKPLASISLLNVYEAIEGPVSEGKCLLTSPACSQEQCIFGNLLGELEDHFRDHMSGTTLADLSNFFDSP